jgi:hypothetical protein
MGQFQNIWRKQSGIILLFLFFSVFNSLSLISINRLSEHYFTKINLLRFSKSRIWISLVFSFWMIRFLKSSLTFNMNLSHGYVLKVVQVHLLYFFFRFGIRETIKVGYHSENQVTFVLLRYFWKYNRRGELAQDVLYAYMEFLHEIPFHYQWIIIIINGNIEKRKSFI